MSRPDRPVEESQLTRRDVGYSFHFSYETGKPGDRQKLSISGNEYLYETAMAKLKETKIRVMELASATAEELLQPPQFEGYKKEEEPLH